MPDRLHISYVPIDCEREFMDRLSNEAIPGPNDVENDILFIVNTYHFRTLITGNWLAMTVVSQGILIKLHLHRFARNTI